MEDKIDDLSNALMAMQNVMVQSGILNQGKNMNKNSGRDEIKTASQSIKESTAVGSNSETTIYDNAVVKEPSSIEIDNGEVVLNLSRCKPVINSSDEQADTSDELINVTDQFIADCAAAAEAERHRSVESQAHGSM